LDRVLPAVAANLTDPNAEVRSYARSAACDIHRYVNAIVPGYDPEYTEAHYENLRNIVEVLKKRGHVN
jgi:hypothetical protein